MPALLALLHTPLAFEMGARVVDIADDDDAIAVVLIDRVFLFKEGD